MSELKAYKMVDEKYCTDCVCVIPSEVYLKSEADKVIAELKEHVKSLILDNYLKDKEIRHHKFKRCLAMAKACCEGRDSILTRNALRWRWWDKWFNRWLELAEKFKEGV